MTTETREQPATASVRAEGEKGGELTLYISGRLALDNLDPSMHGVRKHFDAFSPSRLTVDLSGLEYLDSYGALLLFQLEEQARAAAIAFDFRNMPREALRVMGLLDRDALVTPPIKGEERHKSFLEETGDVAADFFEDFLRIMTFVGELLEALLRSLFNPRLVRWQDVTFYVKRAGVDGLPIVGLLSLLLGLIIAFMSSLQLKPFGANIYVANLVGIAIVRELGPIMTAIIVAGRSGSAFAAEIGTMQVNEEVDALVTMGFDPTHFLAVPKVLAAMIVVPVLTLYADVFGILGGMFVGVTGLDLTVQTYAQQTLKSIRLFDFTSSLVKAVVFAGLISGISCQRGLEVRGGAEAVGASTTSAVVSSIFLIIVADSAFAIILYYLR